jgi:hypothetical protein
MVNPAVVIPAFKREKSLGRLLHSVNQAYYPESVQLVISLDFGATEDVKKTAQNFDFKHGSVQIIEQTKKLGLKDHIMVCADFSLQYGSVIILEEDLIVSPGYYNYAKKALDYYDNENSVAGISLYSQRFNETAQLPFEPLKTECSAYFMKLVCSWGQAWSSKQWKEFKDWYSDIQSTTILNTIELPENVKDWSKNSWKKYFNAYLIKKDKYVVYPYNSYSTHCGDEEGEHIRKLGNLFQVPLSGIISNSQFVQFPNFTNHLIKYDMHMESSGDFVGSLLGLENENIEVDLYGTKSINQLLESDYILSSKKINSPIQSFPLQFKPLELNMKFESYDTESQFFYLYKTNDLNEVNFKKPNHLRLAQYFSYQNILSGKILRSFFQYMMGK